MKSGLLWFDNSAKPIAAKIEDAAKRYREKFGTTPDTCFINPRDLESAIKAKPNIKIHIATKATIMPNHIWLGVSE